MNAEYVEERLVRTLDQFGPELDKQDLKELKAELIEELDDLIFRED